jgi:hypothetical protein
MQIVMLERHLDDQRGTLKKALGPNPAVVTLSNENSLLKVTILSLSIHEQMNTSCIFIR